MTKEELKQLENDLWSSADTLRANSALKSNEYATPVLRLIFLKFADNKYRLHEEAICAEYEKHLGKRTEKELSEIAIARCGFYLPDHARYDYLLNLSGDQDIAKAIKLAMTAVEQYKTELAGVLPQDAYYKLAPGNDGSILGKLLINFANIPDDADGDMFGQIYEYFLGNFALAEGQGGGEFFTPRSVVQLMVEIPGSTPTAFRATRPRESRMTLSSSSTPATSSPHRPGAPGVFRRASTKHCSHQSSS